MTSSSEFDEAFEPDTSLFGNHFPISDRSREAGRSLQVLERLASTLGLPVEAFFDENARSLPTDEATAMEVAELTRAFIAIDDPIMRRYCLDVVRLAGSDEGSDGAAAASA